MSQQPLFFAGVDWASATRAPEITDPVANTARPAATHANFRISFPFVVWPDRSGLVVSGIACDNRGRRSVGRDRIDRSSGHDGGLKRFDTLESPAGAEPA